MNTYQLSPSYVAVTVLSPAVKPVISKIATLFSTVLLYFTPSISIVTLFVTFPLTFTIILVTFPTTLSFTSMVIGVSYLGIVTYSNTVMFVWFASPE